VPALDLRPATWIWFPSQRTLANTFVLFRRELVLVEVPKEAKGWILADSRYRLTVNGQRVQWGPAPFDPRWPEADPVDLAPYLKVGVNAIGIEVLYYGHGEGTWPCGKPGLIFKVDVGGETIMSDESWRCIIDRSHRPGQYRRWFLRALQEECDMRLRPSRWDMPGFFAEGWRPPMIFQSVDGTRPSFASGYPDYAGDSGMMNPASSEIRERSIPMLRETEHPAELVASGAVDWKTDPDDWFEFRAPDSFALSTDAVASAELHPSRAKAGWTMHRLPEGMVGWPYVEITAPAGTIVELLPHEAHNPANPPWLDTGFFSWSRFITTEGRQRLETFDFEAFRWMQVHVRGEGKVTVHEAGIRRRTHPWPGQPNIKTSDKALQRLFEASLNTLNNSAQETCVDGMARERQQYSGDGGHQLIAARYAFGAFDLSARFVTTFSQGLSLDGYFMDSWPAYDRLARISQKQVGASYWGPILDHGVGFVQDCHRHFMHTGDKALFGEVMPRLKRFVEKLLSMRGADGLLPVENLGVTNVWIDHEAYRTQADRQCAFNLYVAQMLRDFANLQWQITSSDTSSLVKASTDLRDAVRNTFWSDEYGCLIVNKPRLGSGETPRACDRSLATWILGPDTGNKRRTRPAELLAEMPEWVGRSYPANAVWRYWGLAASGHIQSVIDDFRTRWATMKSVVENNTLQEFWDAPYDSGALWSHCPVAPLILLYQGILGIRPADPGFGRVEIFPQFGDIPDLVADAHTPHGPIHIEFDGKELRVISPVPGTLSWNQKVYEIKPGVPLAV
jgi:hypothetical protein